jgi:SagB-type dehydrogenase family enzyme
MAYTSALRTVPVWMSHMSVTLAEGVLLRNTGDDKWVLHENGQSKAFRMPQSKMSDVLLQLSSGGCRMDELIQSVDEPSGPFSVAEQMSRLWRAGCLTQTLSWGKKTVAVLRARGETQLFPAAIEGTDRVTLTENGCVRRKGANLIVEAVECGAEIEFLSPEYGAAAASLVSVVTANQLAERHSLPETVITGLLSWLITIRMASFEHTMEAHPASQQWSFADRLLHARSRSERQIDGYGATFPHKGEHLPFPPAARLARNTPRISLARPDLAAIAGQDSPFTAVLETRRSVRDYDDTPVTASELGEFLYRAARIRGTYTVAGVEHVNRPFPSAGGLHELEFYLVVNQCAGIPAALYRYDGVAHELEHVTDPSADTKRLLVDAAGSAGIKTEPQILVILAARFSRLNSKYESIVYALTLKNVGVIYQTMYLVATAMGLGGCALGGGSSARFCHAAETDYWEESSVGEFMLGKPRAGKE